MALYRLTRTKRTHLLDNVLPKRRKPPYSLALSDTSTYTIKTGRSGRLPQRSPRVQSLPQRFHTPRRAAPAGRGAKLPTLGRRAERTARRGIAAGEGRWQLSQQRPSPLRHAGWLPAGTGSPNSSRSRPSAGTGLSGRLKRRSQPKSRRNGVLCAHQVPPTRAPHPAPAPRPRAARGSTVPTPGHSRRFPEGHGNSSRPTPAFKDELRHLLPFDCTWQ